MTLMKLGQGFTVIGLRIGKVRDVQNEVLQEASAIVIRQAAGWGKAGKGQVSLMALDKTPLWHWTRLSG